MLETVAATEAFLSWVYSDNLRCLAHGLISLSADYLLPRLLGNRDLKIGRRDELGRLPEVNLPNRACAQEFQPRVFAVVVSSRTPFREFCRRVENVSIFIFF